jgi:hypothetical protein
MMPPGRTMWALICVAVLGIILSLGLWPFHAPRNKVAWLKDRPGLEFSWFGSAIGSGVLRAPDSTDLGGSIELWLRPGRIWDKGTVVGFSSLWSPHRLLLRQSLIDLEIETGTQLYVNGIFRKARPIFLTIASGAAGTSVYLDGVLVKSTPQFRLSTQHFTGPRCRRSAGADR